MHAAHLLDEQEQPVLVELVLHLGMDVQLRLDRPLAQEVLEQHLFTEKRSRRPSRRHPVGTHGNGRWPVREVHA